jgi:hypothetical protein
VTTDNAPTPAGWYAEPSTGQQRYWDGREWGPYASSYGSPQPPAQGWYQAPADDFQGGLVACGYVFAVLIPLVGFILGIVTITRPSKATSRHGIWIIVLSVVVFVVAIAIVSSGNSSSSTSTY